jgi:glycosyltransferase involved in cell wall biosynthesis
LGTVHVLEIIGKRPVGGVGTVMLNYQKFIDANKVQMDYLIFGEAEEAFDRQVKALGSKVYTYPALSGRQMGRTKKYLDEFFREHKGEYEIVHLHAPYIAGMVFAAAGKNGAAHRIVHSHATLYAESKVRALRNRILWMLSQGNITDRIACSEAAGKFLFRNKPYTVLKNAIDCDAYLYDKELRDQVRQREGIAEGQLVIGNVGRFSQQKNQTYLIDLFAAAKEKEPNCVLWLVGDGELRSQIERKIQEHGLRLLAWDDPKQPEHYDVRMFGMVEQTRELYQAMDVMVMPSLYEGLPMVGVEAQTSGLPCVLSDAITREVDIAGAVYLPLDAGLGVWADAALSAGKRGGRCSRQEELDALGFNIKIEAKRLEKIYRRMAQNGGIV